MSLRPPLRGFMNSLLLVDSAKIFAVNLVGAGLAFLTHVLFARWLTVDSYGGYVFALSWLNILLIGVQVGLNVSVVRFIAEYRAHGDLTAIDRLVRFSNGTVALLAVLVAVAGSLVLAFGFPHASDELAATFYIMFALTAVLGLLHQRMAVLQGFERVFESALLFETTRPLLLIVAVACAAVFWRVDAALVMAGNLLATLLVLVAMMHLARRHLGAAAPRSRTRFDSEQRAWLKISLPYLVITASAMLLTQADILLIGSLLGPEQAGLYAPAAKVAALVAFPVAAIRARLAPTAARMYAEQDIPSLQRTVSLATLAAFAGGLGILLVIVPLREPVLALFGPLYVETAEILLILTAGYVVFAFFGAVEMFFLIGPFERTNVWIILATVAVNLSLSFLLIRSHGITGAAYAMVAALAFRALLTAFVVYRRTGILPLRPWILVKGLFA